MKYNIKVRQKVEDDKLDAGDRQDNPSGVHDVEAKSIKEALDEFHATVPITCLEHFDIRIRRSPEETFKCPPLFIEGPEGLPLWPEPYRTLQEAIEAAARFPLRFVHQGYYAGVRHRIDIQDLPGMLHVRVCDDDEDDDEGYGYDEQVVEDSARSQVIRQLAHEQHNVGDDLQIDSKAIISEGDDNGCYIASWIWVDFAGTELDKEREPT